MLGIVPNVGLRSPHGLHFVYCARSRMGIPLDLSSVRTVKSLANSFKNFICNEHRSDPQKTDGAEHDALPVVDVTEVLELECEFRLQIIRSIYHIIEHKLVSYLWSISRNNLPH